MGSFSMTQGSIKIKPCPETNRIIEELRTLASGMDEDRILSEPADENRDDPGVVMLDIYICGHMSATHSTSIDDKIRQLGPYALEAAEIHTEWEGEQSHYFIGSESDVERAESARALEEIEEHAKLLRGADIQAAQDAIRDAQASLDRPNDEEAAPSDFCENPYCDNPGFK